MALTKDNAVSQRYDSGFANVVPMQGRSFITVDESLSGQGGLLMCVSVHECVNNICCIRQALSYFNFSFPISCFDINVMVLT